MDILTVIRRNPFAFPAACVATAAMVFVSEGSYRESAQSLDEAVRITLTRGSIQALTQGVLDAESGQRGYLLTNRKEYLQPYRDARQKIDEALHALRRYYVENPEHGPVLQRLSTLTEAKLAALAESIRLHDEGKVDAATEIVLSDIGKGAMEDIRTVGVELMAIENANRDETRANIYRSLMVGRIGVAALSKVGGFMELRSFSFQRDPIMVVHTHFGEGPTVHPDDSKKFVGFNALLDLSSDFPIVVPLRDPLLSIITRSVRIPGLQNEYIIDGFMSLARNPGKYHFMPVDIIRGEPYEVRLDRLQKMLEFVGLESEPNCKLWAASWPSVNTVGPTSLHQAYESSNLEAIKSPIGSDFNKLMEAGPEIRPFLESTGYKNLIWWDEA